MKQVSGSHDDSENVYFSLNSSNSKSFQSPKHLELDLSRSLIQQNQTSYMGGKREENCSIVDETCISVLKSDKLHRLVQTLKVSSKRSNKLFKVSPFASNFANLKDTHSVHDFSDQEYFKNTLETQYASAAERIVEECNYETVKSTGPILIAKTNQITKQIAQTTI